MRHGVPVGASARSFFRIKRLQAKVHLFSGSLFFFLRKTGSTGVLVSMAALWYCYAIVIGEILLHYGAVWARFVLVTSVLLCLRFSTLLARHCKRIPAEKRAD